MNWMENCSFVGHNIFMKMWWECVNVFDNHFLAHFIWKFPPPKINSEGSVLVTVMSSVLVYLGLLSPSSFHIYECNHRPSARLSSSLRLRNSFSCSLPPLIRPRPASTKAEETSWVESKLLERGAGSVIIVIHLKEGREHWCRPALANVTTSVTWREEKH